MHTLSDREISNADNSQAYNGFSYALGNSQQYIDPTGYSPQSIGGNSYSISNSSSATYESVDPDAGVVVDDIQKWFRRGYTGHEMLPEAGLIHMNARLYDSHTGRFLSPDPYISDPSNSQSYNRYSYALNNPTKYIDPIGEFIVTAIVVGAVLSGGVGYLSGRCAGLRGDDLAAYTFGSAVIGGISGGVGAGVSAGISAGIGGVAGGINGFGTAGLNGGNVGQGFINGAISGLAAGAVFGGLGAIAPSFSNASLAGRYAGKAAYAGLTGAASAGAGMFGGHVVEHRRVVTTSSAGLYTSYLFHSSYQYDITGKLIKMQYPDGESVKYTYSDFGKLQQVQGKKSNNVYTYIAQAKYDHLGRQVYTKYGNGLENIIEYDDLRKWMTSYKVVNNGDEIYASVPSYDMVGNILSINNATQQNMPFTLTEQHTYSYDDIYRLSSASGNMTSDLSGSMSSNYTQNFSFSGNGKLLQKNSVVNSGGAPDLTNTYNNTYIYNTPEKPNQPSQIGDKSYDYDTEGNLTTVRDASTNAHIFEHSWNQARQLQATLLEDSTVVHHVYDASGMRAAKLSGDNYSLYLNNLSFGGNGTLGRIYITPTPYILLEKNKYSKHYFVGSQRIASKIGNTSLPFFSVTLDATNSITSDTDDWYESTNSCPEDPVLQHVADNTLLKKQAETQYQQILANAQGFGVDSLPNFISSLTGVPGYGVMGSYSNFGNTAILVNPDEETLLYYYHSNHLGSTSLLTDIDGEVYQYTAYMPFGEAIQHRRLGTKVSPYLFNGKERDRETGLYYYGARFYDPTVSLWLSVDPLAEKYPSISPYVYCITNPINVIDPDGREIFPVHGTWSKNSTWGDLNGIFTASYNLFGDGNFNNNKLTWSGGNYTSMRTKAAKKIVTDIIEIRSAEGYDQSEPVTLVGHSHGGNVSIEALNMMAKMKEFDNVQLNLLTINTPVREDYQLSEKATGRVNHVNVYDPKDPVQSNGGKTLIILPCDPSNKKGTGEFGSASRTFENTRNIKVDNPQGLIKTKMYGIPYPAPNKEIHNSHNRVNDWIKKTEDK